MKNSAFEKIYAEYSRLVYWAAYRVAPSRETAEDITQMVFERVLLNESKLEKLNEAQLKAWLYRVATNLALDILRKASHEKLDSEPMSEEIADNSPSPELQTADKEQCFQVRRAIDELDEVYRQVIILHYFSELTTREISNVTGISEGTIKSRLVRARALLQEKLKNEV